MIYRWVMCDHHWIWRRKRNQGFGYWECTLCKFLSERIPVNSTGHPSQDPPEPGKRFGG